MNIETTNSKITSAKINTGSTSAVKTAKEDSSKFSEELTALSKQEETDEVKDTKTETEKKEETEDIKQGEQTSVEEDKESETQETKQEKTSDKQKDEDSLKTQEADGEDKLNTKMDDILNGLQDTVEEINKVKNPNPLDHSYEKPADVIKNPKPGSDKNKNDEDNILINNDMNIQEPKEPLTPQMNSGMNFNTNGQPFREFINNQQSELGLSQKDLEEESAVLSTMSENLAIASKNMLLAKNAEKDAKKSESVLPAQELEIPAETVQPKTKTVSNEQGIKKVDTKTNVTVETVVKYDNVIMDAVDVEFFTKLVENGSVDMNSVRQSAKSSQVSKTLADMLAKSMQDNQPVRIDFDNNISVIIKVSRQGKISADFLPSSQVAEAYLKENLPLLRQRFDENNIEYDELNQRRQRQDEKEDRKKGRKDE